ncbi:hypothetical protein [Streptomyces sp. DSM 118878]
MGLLAALTVMAACGDGGEPDPKPSASVSSPVSFSLTAVGDFGDPRLGTALDISNDGRPRTDVVVRVRMGLGHAGDPLPGLERKLDGGWEKVELTPEKKGSVGTFRMDLPRGSSLAFLRITPRASPRVEGERLPVDVTMTDGSRTLARKQKTVKLATLSLDVASPKEPVVLRKGHWTEVEYTVTNRSHSTYPKAQIQAEYSACAADPNNASYGDTCPDSMEQEVTTALRTQWHDGTGWKAVTAPDDNSLIAETLTMRFGTLPADSTRKFRLRFTGSEDLNGDVRRLVLTARVNGKAVGATERSLGVASALTFDIH